MYGRDWKKVATAIKSRTPSQIRSHAQKYFQKLSRSPNINDGPPPLLDEDDKDAFSVLDYLETTLKNLKRRRDDLNNRNVTLNAKENSQGTSQDASVKPSTGNVSSNKSPTANSLSNISMNNYSHESVLISSDSDQAPPKKFQNMKRDGSSGGLDMLLEAEEYIALQALCGTRDKIINDTLGTSSSLLHHNDGKDITTAVSSIEGTSSK